MLDLNLDIFSSSFSSNHQTLFTKIPNQEDSSSVSSVDDTISSSSAAGVAPPTERFIAFGILKGDENAPSSPTRQLLPTAGKTNHTPILGAGGEKEWLKLSSFCGDPNNRPERNVNSSPAKKSRRGPRSRSSEYRGVTFYRRTGRWESHIWDCGKQVYLGGFDTAYAAARVYDRAAIKLRGVDADINFDVNDYKEVIEQMKNLTKEEFVQTLRRESTGFSRNNSKFKGHNLRKSDAWTLGIGQFLGNKPSDAASIKCTGMAKEGVIKSEPESKDLELSLGIPSSGEKRAKTAEYNPNFTQSDGSTGVLLGKQPFLHLTMRSRKKPNFLTKFEIPAASSGFPCFNAHQF